MCTLPPEEASAGFSIRRQPGGEVPLVTLSGELDLRAATELREALLQAVAESDGTILLDMAELTFIDSTIISVLIMTKKRAEANGGIVRLRNVPDRVQRIFAITGIDELFPTESP